MNAIYRLIEAKTLHYCPACGAMGLDDSDMATDWPLSRRMSDHYGAMCCTTCTDEHVVTEDGALMRERDAVEDCDGGFWSSETALAEAEDEAAAEFSDRRAMRGWL